MNQQMFQEHSDYLIMLNSPDYGNLASPEKPNYVNDIIVSEIDEAGETSGYLSMKPASEIFSPRLQESPQIFSFDLKNDKKKINGEAATGTELLPMLHTNIDLSDGEISPVESRSFSNPSYQKGLVVTDNKKDDIVKTSDNYVNYPQQKMMIKDKSIVELMNNTDVTKTDANNKLDDDFKNRNYVNNQSRDWERACAV